MQIRTGLACFVCLVIMSFSGATLCAQEGNGPGPGRDRVGRRDRNEDRFLEALKVELGLDDEQSAKLQEVVKANQEEMRKAMESRDSKIRELLNEEQAAKYEEMRKKGPGRERQGGQGGSPFGRPGRFGAGAREPGKDPGGAPERGLPELIKNAVKKLELTEEQKNEVKAMLPELQKTVAEAMGELRESGAEPRAAMEKLGAIRDRLFEKIRPILNEEQQKKLDEMAGKSGRRLAEFMPGGQGQDGRRPGGPRDPEQMIKARLEAIRKDLDTIPEVWAILSEKIEGILKTEVDFRRQMREMGDEARKLLPDANDDQVKERMEALRELRTKMEETLKEKREDLRQLLDLKEEAKLIIHGVLD